MENRDLSFGKEVMKHDNDGYRITHNDKPLNPLLLPTMIGKNHERENYLKYQRMNKLSNMDNKSIFRVKLYNELLTYIGNLDLPLNRGIVFQMALDFYNKLTPGTKFRSISLIAPITIYISCLDNTIFLNRKIFTNQIMCKPSDFNRGIREFYKIFRGLYKKHLSDWFRKKIIYNSLIGIKNNFAKIPEDFLNLAGTFLFKTFQIAKNRQNSVISLLVFELVRRFYNGQMKKMSIKKICAFLGVEQSVINNNEALLELMQRRI